MNLLLLGTSFLAGILTILAPCVLPLLPVIIGSTATSENRRKPLIVTASLAISIILFTLLLKASALLIDIPQSFWTTVSGGIVLVFGVFLIMPRWWEVLSLRFRFGQQANSRLSKAAAGESFGSSILIGAALGPVFSSCSPTYFVILATVLPVSFFSGLIYLLVYALGIMLMLGMIAYFGQRLTVKLGWAANPEGWFKKGMGILLIVVGLTIITGIEKKIETAILDAGFNVSGIEENLLSGITGEEGPEKTVTETDSSDLPYLYPAPELNGLENWINSEPISSMDELKGKVVLIDFWTYSCINCIRTLPYLQTWHERYEQDGLVILGVHAPEFQFEKKIENVKKAVKEFGLTYPVVQDNDFKLWRAYNNHYWPAKYLIDRNGFVRYTHFGEGDYDETESAITELLNAEKKSGVISAQSVQFRKIGTHETYIGLDRRKNFIANAAAEQLGPNQWTLRGDWEADGEKAVSLSEGAAILMDFTAMKANLVIGGSGTAEVLIDGETATAENAGRDVKDGILTLDGERLYELTDFKGEYKRHLIEIRFHEPGTELFAWTFG